MSNQDTLKAITANCDLFHDPSKQAFISIRVGNRTDTYPVDSPEARDYIQRTHHQQTRRGMPTDAVVQMVSTLRAEALYEGQEHRVFIRAAKKDERYILDLNNQAGEVAIVTPDGWRVTDDCTIKFQKRGAAMPLPQPELGGSVDDLWNYVNIPHDRRDFVVAWLVDALRPDTEFPVLELYGEQGSGKTTTQRLLKRLIDPEASDTVNGIKADHDLYLYGANTWLMSLDNLTTLTNQDAYCNIATGGTITKRKLYTNNEMVSTQICRPLIMSGISSLATQQDLVDRTIRIELQQLPKRRDGNAVMREFEKVHPKLLGAILTLLSKAMKNLSDVPEESSARMVCYERLGTAIFLDKNASYFADKHKVLREQQQLQTLDSSPVACALFNVAGHTKRNPLECTVSGLMKECEYYRDERSGWPRSARGFSDAYRRAKPALRTCGVSIEEITRSSLGKRVRVIRDDSKFPFNALDPSMAFNHFDR